MLPVAGERWIELGVVDKCSAQLFGVSNPVGIGWQEDATRADSVDLWIIHTRRQRALLG
jgi:hypothetical protein